MPLSKLKMVQDVRIFDANVIQTDKFTLFSFVNFIFIASTQDTAEKLTKIEEMILSTSRNKE